MNPGQRFIEWAQRADTIKVLVQIGSRVREAGKAGGADASSDWDFQIVTTDSKPFESRAAFAALGLGELRAFVSRVGRLGSSRKVTALFDDGELDLVVIPFEQMAGVATQVAVPGGAENPLVRRALADLALVLVGGYKILKDQVNAARLAQFVTTAVPLPRIANAEVVEIAEGFVCDYVATKRLLRRGERVAAQRWLHHQLIEANLRLLHELRQRQGRPTYPDARRLEQLDDDAWAPEVSAGAIHDDTTLAAAIEKAAATCRRLVQALVGPAWSWPVLRDAGTV